TLHPEGAPDGPPEPPPNRLRRRSRRSEWNTNRSPLISTDARFSARTPSLVEFRQPREQFAAGPLELGHLVGGASKPDDEVLDAGLDELRHPLRATVGLARVAGLAFQHGRRRCVVVRREEPLELGLSARRLTEHDRRVERRRDPVKRRT